MTVARAVRLAVARTCRDCNCYPCRCQLDRGAGVADFALRIEPCACGGRPIAAGGSAAVVAAAVDLHNATPAHVAWRSAREEAPADDIDVVARKFARGSEEAPIVD